MQVSSLRFDRQTARLYTKIKTGKIESIDKHNAHWHICCYFSFLIAS